MSGLKVLAIVLILGGVLGLVYHHFSYTSDTHEAKVGSLGAVAVEEADGGCTRVGCGRSRGRGSGATLLLGGGAKRCSRRLRPRRMGVRAVIRSRASGKR